VRSYRTANISPLMVRTSRNVSNVGPWKKQPKKAYTLLVSGQYPFALRRGNSAYLHLRPLRACVIRTQSVCSILSSHIMAFLLYLLLPVYPPVGMSHIVSDFRIRLCKKLLHADAIVIASTKTSMLPNCMNLRLNIRQACLRTVTSS